MTSKLPASLRIAQVVGITTSAFASGGIAAMSHVAIPPLHLSPSPILARQWNELYTLGKSVAPWLALAAGISFSYLATDAGKNPSRHTLYALELYTAAAVLVPGIFPFSLIFMRSTNDELKAKACNSKFGEEENIRTLICSWRKYNYVRATFAVVGSLAGAAAVVGIQ